MARLQPGGGKAALAKVPSPALPDEIVTRAKTGFGVPTGVWMNAMASGVDTTQPDTAKGLVSRRWSNVIMSNIGAANEEPKKQAA